MNGLFRLPGWRWTALLLAALGAIRTLAAEWHVAPGGRDTNDGSAAAPFATLARARDAVREWQAGPGVAGTGATVWLRGGIHGLTATVAFDARDSGSVGAPVVFAGWPGEEVRLSGGRTLDAGAARRVESAAPVWARLDPLARGQVYVLDLRAQGVTDFGSLRPRGFGLSAAAPLELFWNGRPLTLAQWPNRREPWARTATALSSTQFTYAGARPERWTQAGEAWLHGFFKEAWADFHVKVATIDVARRTITLASAPGTYGIEDDRPYVAYNLLEELDEPGEYFVDRTAGLLYFWPPEALAGAALQVSLLEAPLLQVAGSRYLTFRDLTLEAGRAGLVRVEAGDHVRFEHCQFRNAGQFAAAIAGTANGLDHCEVVDCGEDGVRLSGGSRAALTAGENYVTNSRLHRVSRLAWTYHPAVSVSGCGHLVVHNLMDDLPHSAVLFSGNNHRLEANEIRRVCRITSDAGAIYTGRDWGYRGNVIRGNFLHHIGTAQEGFGAHGVYLDDCVSGIEVSGNVFFRINDIALMVGGGRDNLMRGNLIAECGIGHRNDDRGRTRITNVAGDSWNLLARLSAEGIRYQQPPWSAAYPACAAIPATWEAVQLGWWRNPEGTVFSQNAGWGNTTWTAEQNASGTGVFSVYAAMADNQPAHAVLFDEEAGVDRARRPTQLRLAVAGTEAIAFSAIGRTWEGQIAATVAPPASVLEARAVGPDQVELEWSDAGNLARQQETGFVLERRNLPDGPWRQVRTVGADVNFASQTGLAPATTYAYRVRAYNAIGARDSAAVAVTTAPAAMVPGTSTRVEAETAGEVVSDVGTLGTIGATDATLDSGRSMRLYDPGDTLRLRFTLPAAGMYRVGVRVRSGSSGGPRAYWPGGYRFKLNGEDLVLTGDAATVSARDPSYGISYWGTMYSEPLSLAAGGHALEVRAVTAYGVVDLLEFAPLSRRPIVTYAEWREAHFASDQRAEESVAGPGARPVGDSLPNLLKYALGLDPWAEASSSGLRVTEEQGRSRVSYSRPAGVTGVRYEVEGSEDGGTWMVLTETSVVRTEGVERVEATGPLRRYFRLRVSGEGISVSGEVLAAGGGSGARSPRLSNLSVRAVTGPGTGTLIAGFHLGGAGTKGVLVRGAGPALVPFGVSGVLADPRLRLFRGATEILANDDWSVPATGTSALAAAAGRVGAFSFAAASRDAAALPELSSGSFTLQVGDVGTAQGVVLAEIYDADPAAAGSSLRLDNLSARARVGTAAEILVAGFTVAGPGESVVLLRAAGPALGRFGVDGVLADPRLELFRGAAVVAANDNWGSQGATGSPAAVEAMAGRVGAFALDPGSRDAALLAVLPAGSYTLQVSGVGGTTGVALVEVYEAP